MTQAHEIEQNEYQIVYYTIQRDLHMEVARLRKSVGESPIDYPARARYYNRLLRQALRDRKLMREQENEHV